jgi:RHS repeat-associated protein
VLVEANGPGGGVAYVYGEPLLAMSRELTSGAVAFYHGDALGSVRNLTDVLGGPLASHSYDAYGWPGRPAGAQGEYAPRFLGQWGVFSEATGPGQYRMGLRTYDANTGRFLTLDPYPAPLGQPLLAAPYVYALNNPLVELDPVGLRPKKGEPTVNKPALGGVICVVTGGCIVKGIVSAKILTVGTVLVGTAGLGLVAVGGWLIYQYWWVPKQDRPPSPRLPLISQPVRRLEKGIRRTLQTRITNQRNSPRLKSLEQVDLQVDDTLSAPDKVGESRREAQKFINPTGRGTDF